MEKAEVDFHFEGTDTIINCNINDKMKDIINTFLIVTNNNQNCCYLYNGTKINIDLTYNEQANKQDKNRKRMDIIVIIVDEVMNEDIDKIISKEIICPECKENILIDIKDNFKFCLSGCKNNHKFENILLDKFEKYQKINLNEIVCNICNKNHKNDDFGFCFTCNKNICNKCKPKHKQKQNHIITNFDDKNYICKNHYRPYIKYCQKCKEDICIICENEHKKHEISEFDKEISIKKDDLMKSMVDLKNVLDIFKFKIKVIKEILNTMTKMVDIYYKINKNIINKFNENKMNYYLLKNLNEIKINNSNLINDINKAINEDKIYEYAINKFYNEKGEKYIGAFKNNLKEGKGILYYDINCKSKIKRYEGQFLKDQPNGKGRMYWNDGDRYEGEFTDGKPEGKGIMYCNNGDMYEGEFKNGKAEGKGILYSNNGEKYKGDFKKNKKEGKGIYVYNNGDMYNGDWKNDLKEGNGIYYYKNGKKQEGTWKNGKLEIGLFNIFK